MPYVGYMYHGERFNGISHLFGALLATAGATLLITFAGLFGDTWKVVGSCIYGAGMILVYTISTVYHSSPGPEKNFLQKLDHIAIYVMIAGSYTPFCLVPLRGPWGWFLLTAVWSLVVVGTLLEIFYAHKSRIPSLVLYFLMGFLALLALGPLTTTIAWNGFLWLVAGGLLYIFGFLFYVYDEKFAHFHGIWHLFVIMGSFCHYVTVLFYVVKTSLS